MSSDRNLAETAARAWIERFNRDDAAAFADLYAADGVYIDLAFGIERQGKEFVALLHQRWRGAVSAFSMEAERVLVDGPVAVVQYKAQGRFDGSPLGTAERPLLPTMKSFNARGVVVVEVNQDGLITSTSDYYDRLIMPNGEEPLIRSDSVLPPPGSR